MGSTKVSTPAPVQPSPAETKALEAQAAQLENLTKIQQAQFEQFQQFAPEQLKAFTATAESARLATEEAKKSLPLQQKSLEAQVASFELAQEEAKRRAQLEKLTLPFALEAAGKKAIFDDAGNIIALEDIPGTPKTELQNLQESYALESTREALRGIRGEVPVGDPFENRIDADRTALRERLRRQLGPGYENSSPGIEALSEFEARANEARENIRFGRLSQSSALSQLGSDQLNQAILRDLDILRTQSASTLPGAFSMAGSIGGSASDSLARAFALSQNVMAPGSQALTSSGQLAQAGGAFAGDIAGQYATDRRLMDQYNYQAALQSAANRATQMSGIFGAIGTAGGLWAKAGFPLPSSLFIKENKRPVNASEILDAVQHLPVERWVYEEGVGLGSEDHIGPYAEEFQESFGVGDGKTINVIDAIGVLFAAVKALAQRMDSIAEVSDAAGIS